MTTSAATDVLLERARAWAAEDPDDSTRAELQRIIADVEGGAEPGDLADRFAGTLEFGTAGLRGAVGAGPNRMNRVVVTASHNPPQDNGYKVYLGDGSQIVPPADAAIAAKIDAVGRVADLPRGAGATVLGEHLVDRYLDTIAELAFFNDPATTEIYT